MEVDTYICPTCGSEARVGAKCPGCAPKRERRKRRVKSAPREGKAWEQDATYDGLDLPDEDFAYDEFVAKEFGSAPHRRVGIKWYWWVTAAVLVVLLIAAIASGLW